MEALPELRHVCIKQVSPSIYLQSPGFITIDDDQLQVMDVNNIPPYARALMKELIDHDREIGSMRTRVREMQTTRAITARSMDKLHACEMTQSVLPAEQQLATKRVQ